MRASGNWARGWLALLVFLAACSPVRAPAQLAPPTAPLPDLTFTPVVEPRAESASPAEPTHTIVETPAPRRSVVLLSLDGGRADLLSHWMEAGELPVMAELARQGVQAEWLQSVDPTLTAPAHASLATGALPGHTGIVSNAYHNPNDSFYWYREGLEAPLEGGEPVWVAASRAGLKTATVFFPGSSPSTPAQMADLSIGYGLRLAYSKQHIIPLAPAEQSWKGSPHSYSPALEGVVRIPQVACVHLLALDGADDGVAAYDQVLLAADPGCSDRAVYQSGAATSVQIELQEWGSLTLLPYLTAGALFIVQEITSGTATLFHTGVYRNQAAPRELQTALDQKFGFFIPGADSYALEHGWITASDQSVLLGLAARWMAAVTAWVYQTYHPDLLLAWQDALDAAGHAFFLVDARQAGYSPERAEEYAGYYLQAVRAVDRSLGALLKAIDPKTTTLLVTADHGMAPIHTRVYVNTILERAGLLTLDRRDYVVVERSKAFAVASGGSVHVYLNSAGREEQGFLNETEAREVQAQVMALFQDLTDPESGEPVFQRVLDREGTAALGLEHTNSGDVFAQAAPGYVLDGWRGERATFAPADYYGQHGYNSQEASMRGLFLAYGGGLPAGETLPSLRLVDIAPTIGALLGFPMGSPVDGEAIPALLPGR